MHDRALPRPARRRPRVVRPVPPMASARRSRMVRPMPRPLGLRARRAHASGPGAHAGARDACTGLQARGMDASRLRLDGLGRGRSSPWTGRGMGASPAEVASEGNPPVSAATLGFCPRNPPVSPNMAWQTENPRRFRQSTGGPVDFCCDGDVRPHRAARVNQATPALSPAGFPWGPASPLGPYAPALSPAGLPETT